MSEAFISLAIEQLNRNDFEVWCQEVLYQDKNYEFEPTGGVHDGGQDGFIRAVIGQTDHYVQISKEKDTSSKIRKTIRKLRKKRSVSKLTYVTSQNEAQRDILEAKIKSDTKVDVVIHDLRWLYIQAQLHDGLKNSLFVYSKTLLEDLTRVENTERRLDFSARLSIVSYLEAHVRSLPGSENFQNICLDTLIYNELIGTDPDLKKFKSADEIEEKIISKHPNVLAKADRSVHERLVALSSKKNDPRIRKHPGENYALPYSVRNHFNDENLSISRSEDAFVGSINARLNDEDLDDAEEIRPYVIACVRATVEETYRTQAMNFAASFSNRDFDPDIKVFEIIEKSIRESSVPANLQESVRNVTAKLYRYICYSSNEEELQYLTLLLKFFTVRFVMDGDDAVARYFSDMAAKLRIYVGTDIIVRCLSEVLVQEPSRGMTNSLQLLASAGVRLRVTRQTLEEVFHHICLSTKVFRNEYEHWFRHANLDQLMNCDRILVRSFFYAFFEPERHAKQPKSWSDFLGNFGVAAWFAELNRLNSDGNIDEFGSFLVDKFCFEFVEIDEVLKGIDTNTAELVCQEILLHRDAQTEGAKILAMNDSQMALFINSERTSRKEKVSSDLYGFNTWWLTEETTVLKALKKHQQRYDIVMHPQFLMNHFVLDPKIIKKSKGEEAKITPTLFGLRITARIPPDDMKEFIKSIGNLADLDEAAIRARIRHASNKLKLHRPVVA